MDINKTKNITNKKELIEFLKKENNSYAQFIIDKLENNQNQAINETMHMHHIIPVHRQGPNQSWNFIKLTVKDHATAHLLLHQNYGHTQDLGAYQMLSGQTALGVKTIRQVAIQTMRKLVKSFWNPATQKELGKRPKKQRKPYARNRYMVAALVQGFDLQHIKTEEIVSIGPGECLSLNEAIEKWLQHPLMHKEQIVWNTYKNKEKSYLTSGLTRMLTGHIDNKTNKRVFSVKGWRIVGINLYSD